MCFRALSGSSMHQMLSRNMPYRDAIRGKFPRQTSRGHNEDLITLEARNAASLAKYSGKCVKQELLGSSNVQSTFALARRLAR